MGENTQRPPFSGRSIRGAGRSERAAPARWQPRLVHGVVIVAAIATVFVVKHAFSPSPVTNPRPQGETIVCFGDSLTAGTGAAPGESYPDHLGRLIGRPVINAGIPGDTTGSARERLARDVLPHHPRIVCITLGGNDLKNGVERTEAFANLEAIVRELQAAGALVVLGGVDVPLFGRGYDDAYADLARRTGSVLVPDVYEGIWGRADLKSDPIHPNGKGYAVMAEHFYAAIKDYL